METMIIEDSTKNIPVASEKEFKEVSIVAAERFMKNISWRCYWKMKNSVGGERKERYGLKSTECYPRVPELKEFSKDFAKLLQNIKHKERGNPFLSKMSKLVKEVNGRKEMIIAADKTSNKYLVEPGEYNRLRNREVEKCYKKVGSKIVDKVRIEQNVLAVALEIDDRLFNTQEKEAFITLKDHKADFRIRPSVRLINPAKNELGKVAMKMLNKIVKEIKFETSLKQCISTGEVINWFKALDRKQGLKFIVFDVEAFYPSITEQLFNRALDWAGSIISITEKQRKVFLSSCRSFLFCGGEAWTKKGDSTFDVGMGAFQGAQVCEIVGLFLLDRLRSIEGFECILYRDDGLGVTRAGPRSQDRMRNDIKRIFKENELGITITVNLQNVDFLDINMNLVNGIYKPYRKPGDTPRYVSAFSNQAPDTLRGIPGGVERRLNENSAKEEVFNHAKVIYQNELNRCGYIYELEFEEKSEQIDEEKKMRKTRRVTWYNPPYSVGVATNMKREF